MGCDASNPENSQAINQGQCVDIDLLIRPKPQVEPEDSIPEYRRMDTLSPVLPQLSSSSIPSVPAPTKMIEHRTSQTFTPPAVEQVRHERFAERFSQIDQNTFHTIPRFSMPSIPQVQPDGEISHEIESYCTFMDGVLGQLLGPLTDLRVKDERQIAVAFV
jgi:hypothetical protein